METAVGLILAPIPPGNPFENGFRESGSRFFVLCHNGDRGLRHPKTTGPEKQKPLSPRAERLRNTKHKQTVTEKVTNATFPDI